MKNFLKFAAKYQRNCDLLSENEIHASLSVLLGQTLLVKLGPFHVQWTFDDFVQVFLLTKYELCGIRRILVVDLFMVHVFSCAWIYEFDLGLNERKPILESFIPLFFFN